MDGIGMREFDMDRKLRAERAEFCFGDGAGAAGAARASWRGRWSSGGCSWWPMQECGSRRPGVRVFRPARCVETASSTIRGYSNRFARYERGDTRRLRDRSFAGDQQG